MPSVYPGQPGIRYLIQIIGLLVLVGLLQDKLTQQACQSFAAVHDSTTPAQRSQAVETLNGYEQDLRALNAQKS